MSYIKQFLSAIKNSFYNPEFYRQVPYKKFSKIVLLYCGLVAIPVFIIASQILVVTIPAVYTFSANEFVDKYYPEGLELTAKDNTFSSNTKEPFSIPLTEEMQKENKLFKNVFVIDTKKDLTLDQIRKHEAFVVVVKDGIVINQENDELRAITLKEANLGNFVITESQINQWASVFLKFLKILLIPVALFLAVFMWILVIAINFFFALFAGLIVQLIMYIKKVPTDFKSAYKIALFALIPGFIVNIFLSVIPSSLPFYVDFALFLLIVLINFQHSSVKHSN